MSYFYYEVEHFYKNGGPVMDGHNAHFPKEMRGEVESISQMVEQLKTDSDWQLGEQ